VTFHPVTLEYEQAEWQIGELLAALDATGLPAVFTLPNADTGGRVIQRMIAEYVEERPSAWLVDNLGTQAYFSLMAVAAAMVGNSSSGIIEAPSLGLPVVNIGTRQAGRVRGANIIDVGYERAAVLEGIRQAVRPEFRESLRQVPNPYDRGRASDMIVERLKTVPLDDNLVMKRFYDLDVGPKAEN
jgi:UDP-N-acetylglucosamine 2-epimerase (non-hydrolysing)/GDP/UDP-N,N'-diacetylbacillosamine 2-epimerase (hydrolysing)